MKGALRLLAGAGVLAFLVVGPVGANTKNSGSAEQTCQDGASDTDTIALGGYTYLWPPNHKDISYVPTFTGESDDDGEIFVTSGSHDEVVNGEELNGSGKPNDGQDVQPAADEDTVEGGTASTAHTIRAERSGRGDGRTYTLHWQVFGSGVTSRDDSAAMCYGDFKIEVPHDQGEGNDPDA